jgi:serine/threonine protein kinase
MERPTWDRIQEIYHSTLPMLHSERREFVMRACGEDTDLVREVNSLLEADASSAGFLENPVFGIGLKILSKDKPNSDPLAKDALIGKTIDDRYLVEKKLGQGGMGTVYLARDVTLHNRPVVIKVLSDASLKNAYLRTRFSQEVEALSRIDHPGVVSVLGSSELPDGQPYIVMQYVNGVTLRSQLSSEGTDLQRAAAILKQLGAALDHIHDKAIYHRDLKPENIMLQSLNGGAELVKVVDFGIAKVKNSVVAPSTANQTPIGTVLYMSPEQLRGERITSSSSDIYSMGVIAFEMLAGRRPFNPVSAPQLIEMHRAGVKVMPADLRAGLSTETQAIILRALAFDPNERYQSAGEFGERLADSLTRDPEPRRAHRLETDSSSQAADTFSNQRVETADTQKLNRSQDGLIRNERQAKAYRTSLKISGAVLAVLVVLMGGWYLYGRLRSNSATSHGFKYWLTVQRMRDGKKYQDPFPSAGQEAFESGYKFQLNISSPEAGYLYLFNDGPPTESGTFFTILYPTPLTNNGVAAIGANQVVQTNWNTFAGQAGSENFWIVWSSKPVQELEAAKTEAFQHADGALTGDLPVTVRAFLKLKQTESKSRMTKDADGQLSTVRGTGDPLVREVRFQHH